jgi:hypothetical protein
MKRIRGLICPHPGVPTHAAQHASDETLDQQANSGDTAVKLQAT